MTNRDLEAKLRQTFSAVDTGDCPSSLLSAAMQEMNIRSRKKHISFSQFLSLQVRFIGWKVWTVQGVFLLGICFLLSQLFGGAYWREPKSVAELLCFLSVLVFMTVPPFLYRSTRYKMQEVEAATRFSSVQLLMARLIIIGAGDAALLGGILLTTALTSSLQTGSAMFSLALPFLLASSGFLYFLGHVSPQKCFGYSMGLCAFLLLGLLLSHRHFSILLIPPMGWIGGCAVLIAFCCHQFQYLIYHCTFAEIQIA